MIQITCCYRFLPLTPEQIEHTKIQMEQLSQTTGLRGLLLLGPEGFNGTVAGSQEAISQFKTTLSETSGLNDLEFKDSTEAEYPFRNFRIKIKKEIVTLGRTDLVPHKTKNNHLSPAEWHQAVQDPNAVVIDTRNDYEVDIGKFKSAIDFRIKEFHAFPDRVKESNIDKDKKILIYCTGGIRCEKAILAMEEQGYKNVYQLDGGILNYLKEFPDAEFDGECFVFDYRVAVDQNLQPSKKYSLCPHCGQPSNLKINCAQCNKEELICTSCHKLGKCTCSKNCTYHHSIQSRSNKPQIQEHKIRGRIQL